MIVILCGFFSIAFLLRHCQHLDIKSTENPVTSPTVHQLFPPFLPHPTHNLVRGGRTLITKTVPASLDILNLCQQSIMTIMMYPVKYGPILQTIFEYQGKIPARV